MASEPLTPHAYLSEIGRRGGKIGGKRRLETMSAEARSAQASRAAYARWGKHERDPVVGMRFIVRIGPSGPWSGEFVIYAMNERRKKSIAFYMPCLESPGPSRHMTRDEWRQYTKDRELQVVAQA